MWATCGIWISRLRANFDYLDSAGPAIAEELARRVVANGGRVLALPADRLPGGAPITAVLRYAQ